MVFFEFNTISEAFQNVAKPLVKLLFCKYVMMFLVSILMISGALVICCHEVIKRTNNVKIKNLSLALNIFLHIRTANANGKYAMYLK